MECITKLMLSEGLDLGHGNEAIPEMFHKLDDLLTVRVSYMKHRHGLALIHIHLSQTLKTHSEVAMHHIQAPSDPFH